MIHSANRRIVPAALITVVVAVAVPVAAQDFVAGEPIGALSEAGEWRPMSDNVKVFGSFHFSESCTFDPDKNVVLAMSNKNIYNWGHEGVRSLEIRVFLKIVCRNRLVDSKNHVVV